MRLISWLRTEWTFKNPSYLSHPLSELGVPENILVKKVSLKPNKGNKNKVYVFSKIK